MTHFVLTPRALGQCAAEDGYRDTVQVKRTKLVIGLGHCPPSPGWAGWEPVKLPPRGLRIYNGIDSIEELEKVDIIPDQCLFNSPVWPEEAR